MTTPIPLRHELRDNGVAIVTIDGPPANAIDRDLYMRIADLFENIDQIGDDVRAVVLRSEGRHFCAGNDLDEFGTMTSANADERMWRVRRAFFSIQDCAAPVVAAVQGAALGTGLAIAASCDFIVAEETARFGLPELTVGVMGGAAHLARMAPQHLVRRMYFTGEAIAARELAAMGVPIMTVPPGSLVEAALDQARRIASFSPTAVRLSKRILNRIETLDTRTGYEIEQGGTCLMSDHPDSKEALRAFAEKRPAQYQPLDMDYLARAPRR